VAVSLGLNADDILGDYIDGNKDDAFYAAENIVASDLLPEESSELKDVSTQHPPTKVGGLGFMD
jgi:hypothetical protein